MARACPNRKNVFLPTRPSIDQGVDEALHGLRRVIGISCSILFVIDSRAELVGGSPISRQPLPAELVVLGDGSNADSGPSSNDGVGYRLLRPASAYTEDIAIPGAAGNGI